MKKLLAILILCASLACYSQAYTNIVPDSSFERLKPCYDTGTFYGVGDPRWMEYWHNGNEGSADFFMEFTCTPSNITVANHPNSGYGNQYPKTGSCYAGLAAIIKPSMNANFREYLRTELLMPLEAGKKYYAGCYVSAGESGDFYSVNNFGLAFSSDTLVPDTTLDCNGCIWETGHPIIFDAQVMNDTTVNLTDTLGWVLVADTFTAVGGEKWLTIGNFRDDAHSIYVPTNHPNADSVSYYFVDDVFLYCIDTSCAIVPTIGSVEFVKKPKPVTIYPNPSSGNVTIEYENINENEFIKLFLYNSNGLIVKESVVPPLTNKLKISFEELHNGVYTLHIMKNTTPISIEKIIILKD